MSELRHDPLQGRWVIIAPRRDLRPRDATTWTPEAEAGADCPFCPGNENRTPPEAAVEGRAPDRPTDGPGWRLRAFPNRFPALVPVDPNTESSLDAPDAGPDDRPDGADDPFRRRLPGVGRHEVIVESPDHSADLDTMDRPQLRRLLEFYRERLLAFEADPAVAHCLVFRNRGPAAGATLAHPHTQIIGGPAVPLTVRLELERMVRHRRRTNGCLYCDLLAAERRDAERLILAREHFTALAPWASRVPGEILILPHRHVAGFGRTGPDELDGLASLLGETCRALSVVLDRPDYNLILHSAPRPESDGAVDYHWHIEILPRLSRLAGFEAGSGFHINPLPPEEAASRMREALAVGADTDADRHRSDPRRGAETHD